MVPATVIFIFTLVTFVLGKENDDVFDDLENELEEVMENHISKLYVSEDLNNHKAKR